MELEETEGWRHKAASPFENQPQLLETNTGQVIVFFEEPL